MPARKIEIFVADDMPVVRELFADLINEYKEEIADCVRDDHLAFVFNGAYDLNLVEASNGNEFELKLKESYHDDPAKFFICFVDEDMPVKRGTAAIREITKSLISDDGKSPKPAKLSNSSPRIRMISYTQKQDIEISEDIAKKSGAVMFLRKTSLADFYEEMIQIIEHLVLDVVSKENHAAGLFKPENPILLRTLSGEGSECELKNYLKFRYTMEFSKGYLPTEKQNNFWVSPDSNDFMSSPICVYSGKKQNLAGCLRMTTTEGIKNKKLIEKAISLTGYRYDNVRDDLGFDQTEVKIDKFYMDHRYLPEKVAEDILLFALANTVQMSKEKLILHIENRYLKIARKLGFVQNTKDNNGLHVLGMDKKTLESKNADKTDVILKKMHQDETSFRIHP